MSLSGGQKQCVAIASAIAGGKEIIIFDEPTSGLDHVHMTSVAKSLRSLGSMGKTILVITHDPELVELCSEFITDRLGILVDWGKKRDAPKRTHLFFLTSASS